jgi:hypothetical protein
MTHNAAILKFRWSSCGKQNYGACQERAARALPHRRLVLLHQGFGDSWVSSPHTAVTNRPVSSTFSIDPSGLLWVGIAFFSSSRQHSMSRFIFSSRQASRNSLAFTTSLVGDAHLLILYDCLIVNSIKNGAVFADDADREQSIRNVWGGAATRKGTITLPRRGWSSKRWPLTC